MASQTCTIVWFRHDLRTTDNPALRAAANRDAAVLPVFIWSPEDEKPWEPGAASRWWLHQSLAALEDRLRNCGAGLLFRTGNPLEVLQELIRTCGADAVYWNRRYEPAIRKRDKQIKQQLAEQVDEVKSFNASLLAEPWEIENKQGKPYQVYTPFSKQVFNEVEIAEPLPQVRKLTAPKEWPTGEKLDAFELEPKIDWAGGIRDAWEPGELGAARALQQFLGEWIDEYDDIRNKPGVAGTSRLSPYLHFGEIGPRQVWAAVKEQYPTKPSSGAKTFLKELVWREFAHHLLYHFPETPEEPLRKEFSEFPWQRSKKKLDAWQKGNTGYPIVDAGMRELWATGWMHNRVRMIVASFLVKHLLIPWQDGAAWFWDTLVDADLANNTLGWQWTAGCGADAAPYFRVFNPILQGEKFDPKGEYARRWVPELAGLPNKYIYRPWEAPDEVLQEASIELGKTYPEPIVDHSDAREEALDAYDAIKKNKN